MNKELHKLILEHQEGTNKFMGVVNGIFEEHRESIELLSKRVDNLVDIVMQEETPEKTECCGEEIIEQTGRCSKCKESV